MQKTITINEKEILEKALRNLDASYTLAYADYRDEIPAGVIQKCIDKKDLLPIFEEDWWADARRLAATTEIASILHKMGLTKEQAELFLSTGEAEYLRDEIFDRDGSTPEKDCLTRFTTAYAYLRFHSNYDCWCGLYEYGNKLQVHGTALSAVLAALSLNPWKVKQAANKVGLETAGPFRNIRSRNGGEVVDYDDFIKDLIECPNYGNWSFFGKLDLGLMYDNKFDFQSLTIPKDTDCGMYNWWNGGGSLHFCKTIRPVRVKDIIRTLGIYKDDVKLVVDAKSNKEYGYVPTDVYGAYYINKENLFVYNGDAKEVKDFFFIPETDRADLVDSLLFESGQEILSGTVGDLRVSVIVCGDVDICWHGESYRNRSCFPDDLVEALRNQALDSNEYAEIIMNNWFECRVWNGNKLIEEDIIDDLSGMTDENAKGLILDVVNSCDRIPDSLS